MSWKKRFEEKFVMKKTSRAGTNIELCATPYSMIDFIEALIKEKDEEIERLKEELREYIEEEAGASL
jgi:hypothetical protein